MAARVDAFCWARLPCDDRRRRRGLRHSAKYGRASSSRSRASLDVGRVLHRSEHRDDDLMAGLSSADIRASSRERSVDRRSSCSFDAILQKKGADIVTIDEDATVGEAARMLADLGIGALVIAPAGQVRGILSERDIVRGSPPTASEVLDTPVASLMTTAVATVRLDDGIDTLMATMTEQRVRHLPVRRRRQPGRHREHRRRGQTSSRRAPGRGPDAARLHRNRSLTRFALFSALDSADETTCIIDTDMADAARASIPATAVADELLKLTSKVLAALERGDGGVRGRTGEQAGRSATARGPGPGSRCARDRTN